METLLKAHSKGIETESYQLIELPLTELGKANVIHRFNGRIILFQDGHTGDFYRKALLKDSNNEVYWVSWKNGNGETFNNRYHIHDLTGLMVQTI